MRNVKGWGGKEGGRRGQASEGGVGGRGGGGAQEDRGLSLFSGSKKERGRGKQMK